MVFEDTSLTLLKNANKKIRLTVILWEGSQGGYDYEAFGLLGKKRGAWLRSIYDLSPEKKRGGMATEQKRVKKFRPKNEGGA